MLLDLTTEQTIALIKALGPTMVAAGSAIWIVLTYLRQQKESRRQRLEQAEKDNITRMFEARKPFNDKQLALYSEVAQVTGRLVTSSNYTSPEWTKNVRRFEQLFWTELSMVEDEGVKQAMQEFSKQLALLIKEDDEGGASVNTFKALQQCSYRLASALRASIASSWLIKLAEH